MESFSLNTLSKTEEVEWCSPVTGSEVYSTDFKTAEDNKIFWTFALPNPTTMSKFLAVRELKDLELHCNWK